MLDAGCKNATYNVWNRGNGFLDELQTPFCAAVMLVQDESRFNALLTQLPKNCPSSAIYTCFRNRAPAHSTGARCFDMLKPNNEANQSIVVTAIGASRSSVWWRKGRALYPRKVMMK